MTKLPSIDGRQPVGVVDDLRRLYETKGYVSPTKNLTVFEENPNQSPIQQMDNLYKEAASRKGWSSLDTPESSYKNERFDFISSLEGFSAKSYPDKHATSVGYGFNLDVPDNKKIIQSLLRMDDHEYNKLKSGRRMLSKSESRAVFEAVADHAEEIVQAKTKGIKLSKHERLALVSLAYNAPSLIGPNLLKALKDGDKDSALNEILYKSNRHKDKGLAKRRHKEAAMFVGMANAKDALPDVHEYLKSV